MRKLTLMTLLFPLLVGLSSCGNQTLEDGVFTIGFEAGYAPFNWTTEKSTDGAIPIAGTGFLGLGQAYAYGYDVMVASHIVTELDYTLQARKISWDGLIPALTSGHIDAIIAGMTDTAARRESVAFSVPYYESELVILVRSDSPYADATTIDDFTGARLAAQVGTVQNDIIVDYATDDGEGDLYVDGLIAATPYETYPDALLGLLEPNSGLDGVLAERPIAVDMIEQYSSQLSLVEFWVDEDTYDENFLITVSVALRKEDTSLLAQINDVLNNLDEATRLAWMNEAILASNGN